MYCLRLVLQELLQCLLVCSLKHMRVPSFILVVVSVSYMGVYVPIAMYGLRLFIVV